MIIKLKQHSPQKQIEHLTNWLVRQKLRIQRSEGEFETIGGLVFGLLGKEPEVGDSVTCEGWLLTVTGKEERRLRTIRLDPIESGLTGAEPSDQSASG